MNAKILIHTSITGGHHLSYQNIFIRLLGGQASTGTIRGSVFLNLVMSPKVFFCTIDDDYFGFFAVSLLRAFLGKSTTGLFLRPLQCFKTERKIIYPMKRLAFRLLRRLPKLFILSIIPHDLHPELREVSHDWIHDPQLWDLWLDGKPVLPTTNLSRRAEAERHGREILIFVGSGSRIRAC